MAKADYHHGNLRAAVLRAAEAELQNDPRCSLSIRALASVIGVSATAPHAHFRTKADLVAALATLGFERLRNQTVRRAAKVSNPKEKIAALAEAYLDFSAENPGLYRIMFATSVDLDHYPELQRASRASYAVLREAICKALPDASKTELGERAFAAWGTVHGFASLLSEGRLADDIVSDRSPKGLAHIAARLALNTSGI